MSLKTLVIVPAYNESLNIEKTIHDLEQNAPEADYIIVNDGSKDDTLKVLNDNNFKYIDGFVNQGLFGAVQIGFKWAMAHDYDVAIQFDGDGQHKAEYIKDIVKGIEEGNDIVIGSRFATEPKPWTARMIGSRIISSLIFITTGKKINDPTSGFRGYGRKCIKEYATNLNNPPEPDTLVYMLKKGRKISEVQVMMQEREFGESYLTLTKSAKYMLRMTISILLIQPFRKRS